MASTENCKVCGYADYYPICPSCEVDQIESKIQALGIAVAPTDGSAAEVPDYKHPRIGRVSLDFAAICDEFYEMGLDENKRGTTAWRELRDEIRAVKRVLHKNGL